MAENRMIRTSFWDDDYISSRLDPLEKFFFLYLLTNPHTHICGIYQLPKKYMLVDTGLEIKNIENILEKFEKDGKIMYRDGWVVMINWIKHQQQGMRVEEGIRKGLKKAPEWCREYMVSIGYGYLLAPKPESESKLEYKSKPKPEYKPEEISKDIGGQAEPVNQEEKKEGQAFGIDDILKRVEELTGITKWVEDSKSKRAQGRNLLRLYEELGREEFEKRLKKVMERTHTASLAYFYKEIKAMVNKSEIDKKKRKDAEEKERKHEQEERIKTKESQDALRAKYESLPVGEQDSIKSEAEESMERLRIKGKPGYDKMVEGAILSIMKKRYPLN